MSVLSLGSQHLSPRSAEDVHEIFHRLGYDIYDPEPFEGDDLDQLDLDAADQQTVNRAYIVAQRDNHTVYLYEVSDLRLARLRSLAWHALQRGTALLVVTRDYREVLFVDPRFVGRSNKSSVRVNKLRLVTSDPTRHDLDTLNAIHAHRRSGQQVYDAQAQAFNVTTITKKFYDEYRRHYERARAAVRQFNPGVREFQDSDQADKLHAFTQRLLGRLMFLYFLQRKGWLGERQRFLTDKYLDTMRQHAHELHGDGETFHYYREVLEPLFFQTMNTRRPGDITQWTGIRIPYLNGGLFDESRDPDGPIILPDSLFDPNSNEGLLAFFNRYNFTITDDTPLEQDVAVDPEMLGKVFENMLEERDRGQSGSFYTPRTIVAYMCQEALAGYLEESASVPRETTRAQFDPDSDVHYTAEEAERVNAALDTLTVLDPAVGSGSFLIGMMNEIIRLRKACYVVMNGVQEAPGANPGTPELPGSKIAAWKEAVIRDTLYGVDIKPEAIEIAQLRLWLALVVDQTMADAKPLPNLDYKLMAGNSLIETIDGEPVLGDFARQVLQPEDNTRWEHVNQQLEMFDPNPVQKRMLLFDEEKQAQHERVKLDELRRQYFSADPQRRRQLRDEIATQERRIVFASLNEKAERYQAQIDELGRKAARQQGKLSRADTSKLNQTTQRLATITRLQADMARPDHALPFFLYRLHFSEVFESKGGFDVVVANPPYVRQELISDQKPELQANYPDVYTGTADLFVYFFARACGLLRRKGQLSFITPNKFMRANYGKKLRGFLATKTRLQTLIDFGDLPIFDATTYPMITLADNQTPNENKIRVMEITALDESESLHAAAERAYALPQSTLTEDGWQLSAPETRALMDKLKAAGVPLGQYVNGRMYRGVLTGLNEAFIIDEAKRAELIAADPSSAEVIKPYLRGRDVKRWRVENAGLYIIVLQNSGDANANNAWGKAATESEARAIFEHTYPAIHAHMIAHAKKLRPRADQGKWWWELRACAYYAEFEKPKIVLPSIVGCPTFAYDTDKHYSNDKTTIVGTSDLFVLATLNSHVQDFFFRQVASTKRGGYFEQKPMYVEQLPIPDVPEDVRQQIASLAQQCLDTARDAPGRLPALEAKLNRLVYQAYGLDEDDIRVIEGHLGDR